MPTLPHATRRLASSLDGGHPLRRDMADQLDLPWRAKSWRHRGARVTVVGRLCKVSVVCARCYLSEHGERVALFL